VILSLFIWSGLFVLLGIWLLMKKKPLLGGLFILIGIFGFVLGFTVTYLYPEKI
jgi:hypothetical protein